MDEDVGSTDDLIANANFSPAASVRLWLGPRSVVPSGRYKRALRGVSTQTGMVVIHVSKDATVTYTLNRELSNRKNQPAEN